MVEEKYYVVVYSSSILANSVTLESPGNFEKIVPESQLDEIVCE